jgi:hypothetical protein
MNEQPLTLDALPSLHERTKSGKPRLKARAYRKLAEVIAAPPPSAEIALYPRHYRVLAKRAWRCVEPKGAYPQALDSAQLTAGPVRLTIYRER